MFFGILDAIYVKTPIYSKKLGLKQMIRWNMGLYTDQIQAKFQKTGDRTVEFLELKKMKAQTAEERKQVKHTSMTYFAAYGKINVVL